MTRQLHLDQSGAGGMRAKTACGRSTLRTPMSAVWSEYKLEPVAYRCMKCEGSKTAELNLRNDAKKAALKATT